MSQTRHRVVFLYSELAGYFLACAKELGQHPEVESVDIVHWPLNPEAPFQFSSTPQYTLHPKKNFNRGELKQLLAQINPTAIVCSGWMDSDYNAMAKAYCKLIPVVLTLDNWWTGSLKQWLAVLSSPFFIRRHFNRAWVPGAPQQPFAEKLGFRGKKLATGFYCADPKLFEKIHEIRKNRQPSKKLLYVGRYIDVKGIRELWTAFERLSDDFPEWELHCIGTGDLGTSACFIPKSFTTVSSNRMNWRHTLKMPRVLSCPARKNRGAWYCTRWRLRDFPCWSRVRWGRQCGFLTPVGMENSCEIGTLNK